METNGEEILHTFDVPVVFASDVTTSVSNVCSTACNVLNPTVSEIVSNCDPLNYSHPEPSNFAAIDPRLVNVLAGLQNHGTVNINVNFNK